MTVCQCTEYEDLEMLREYITKRIKSTKKLRKKLKSLLKSEDSEHELYLCEVCNQTWQSSRAWNWGNDPYLFKVPPIPTGKWLKQPYIQPDELLIYTANLGDFLEQDFITTEKTCNTENCNNKSLKHTAKCLKHHVKNLQDMHKLVSAPSGRWFHPYIEKNFEPNL